jgi:hypothetical protein
MSRVQLVRLVSHGGILGVICGVRVMRFGVVMYVGGGGGGGGGETTS